MRACRLHGVAPVETAPLVCEEVETPRPDRGQVLVAVNACAVCRTDLHVVEGELPPRRVPVIPGHQIVGTVAAMGSESAGLTVGQRVGVAWLHRTCGVCRFCTSGRENLCERAAFTGWTEDGGFATHCLADARFVYPLPADFSDSAAAPLLCAGIIGYRALRLMGIERWSGTRIGIYGFGAAGHVAIQLLRARGAEVFVCTRDRRKHQALAAELGATWIGDADAPPPAPLDAAVIFAPAGPLVPAALKATDRGGTVVLGGIHMSPLPSLPYDLLYGERVVRTVANNTRVDGRDFLAEAARIPVRTHTEAFDLADANQALLALKNDAIRGAAVLTVGLSSP
ncbi:MAG TPA: zinc-dependent alcohol dehydrogenase family protein [Polyangia bacterium]|nr:zinc-dependent alcohol dehydrogenase family protein [Polyangia bacterium]